MTTTTDTTQGKDNKKIIPEGAKAEHSYATINKEAELLLSATDKIVFTPVEDFEYKAPLLDFQKSQKKSGE